MNGGDEVGVIVKGVGGFYTIHSVSGRLLTLHARGRFRNQGISPLVGDKVLFSEATGMINEILPRSNVLNRPRIANASFAIVVASLKKPEILYTLVDKILIQNAAAGLESAICFNKADLSNNEENEAARAVYEKSGSDIIFTSAVKGIGFNELEKELKGKITIFTGVSGAGKSSLIAKFCPNESIVSQEVSRKIGRGKNTTRHAEIYVTAAGDHIVDTPGFSLLDLSIPAESVWKYYPEFYEHSDCRFANCLHLSEPGCNVKEACKEGLISKVRFDSYQTIAKGLIKAKNKSF